MPKAKIILWTILWIRVPYYEYMAILWDMYSPNNYEWISHVFSFVTARCSFYPPTFAESQGNLCGSGAIGEHLALQCHTALAPESQGTGGKSEIAPGLSEVTMVLYGMLWLGHGRFRSLIGPCCNHSMANELRNHQRLAQVMAVHGRAMNVSKHEMLV
jgi:hypothetical protein